MKIRFNQFAKKTIILFLAHIGFTSFTFSQTYFQQQVDYKITAELDTLKNTLSANCIIEYTNNSNDALDQIVFHTWWNAFKDKNSAFASQQIQNG
ncbi:MAG: hypothetical protein HKN51_09425, partial [Saprospiraceae bacterium]|nr:hypothetical protein [Saprospiraceae bacterium]